MPEERTWQLIHIAIPQDHNTVSKENGKVSKYTDLARVIRTKNKVKTEIVPLVIEALGGVSKQLKTYIDVIGIPNAIGSAQISTITSTARILLLLLLLLMLLSSSSLLLLFLLLFLLLLFLKTLKS